MGSPQKCRFRRHPPRWPSKVRSNGATVSPGSNRYGVRAAAATRPAEARSLPNSFVFAWARRGRLLLAARSSGANIGGVRCPLAGPLAQRAPRSRASDRQPRPAQDPDHFRQTGSADAANAPRPYRPDDTTGHYQFIASLASQFARRDVLALDKALGKRRGRGLWRGRIRYRMAMWRLKDEVRPMAPMPPAHTLKARCLDPEAWLSRDAVAELDRLMTTLPPKTESSYDETLLAADYDKLPSCLP